jgi:3-phenylpropionate/trans-cinnamate dioxygenase ferredoxin reductase subunit
MKNFKYIIIGGGMTGDSAAKGIREIDKDGSLAIISSESHLPYDRPPLTKDLWKGKEVEKIYRGTDKLNLEIILDTEIVSLNPAQKELADNKNNKYTYEKLLIATGGKVIKLPFGEEHILYYRTLRDYEKLTLLVKTKNDFIVIGGGFIGTEIAAALAMNGKKVTMAFPENLIGERVFPKDLAEFVTNFYKEKGVEIKSSESALGIESARGKLILTTSSGKEIKTDAVVGGIGIRPNTELAKSAGIKVDNGITVDEYLRTNIDSIYAAGDAANFYNPVLDKRIRIEHADNANKMGKHAGLNMAGKKEPYNYLPFFYSDMFELGYEAIGELNSSFETYSDWAAPFRKGVVYYLKQGKVRGVLLWDVWGKVDEARELIASKQEFKAGELKGKIQG